MAETCFIQSGLERNDHKRNAATSHQLYKSGECICDNRDGMSPRHVRSRFARIQHNFVAVHTNVRI